MSQKKKKVIKIIVQIVIILAMIGILCYMFKDSYKEIFHQIGLMDKGIFIIALILGNCYYLIDAFVYWTLLNKNGYKINYLRCIALAYMSIFFNVTTFGVGIKPAQVAYLHRKKVDPGAAIGILISPYVFTKTTIVVYALIMLAFNNKFVINNFSDTFGYIYAGVGLSIVIITALILVCGAKWFHRLICKIADAVLGRGRLAKYNLNEKIKAQISVLHDASCKIIRKPVEWLRFVALNALRQSCWYFIPVIAIFALGGNLGDITIGEALTVTALMQLLMGVIPTSGGVGSLEVVFSLLFAAIFGKITAGSCMIVYRLSTYYIPFIISMIIMLALEFDLRKVPEPE